LGRHALGALEPATLGDGLVEVEVGGDGSGGVARADHAVEDGLDLGLHRVLEGLHLLGARRRGAGAGIRAVVGEHRAAGVGDDDLLGVEAADARGDQVHDALDLRLVEVGAGGGVDEDGGGGGVLLVGEDLLLRKRQVYDGRVDAVDGLDRLGELALHRPLEVGLLLELGGVQALVVEELVAASTAGVGRQPLARQRDPRGVDVRARHHDRAAAAGDLVGNTLGVELLDHRAGVLAGEVGVEGCIAGGGGPAEHHEGGDQQRDGADDGDRLLAAGEGGERLADPRDVAVECLLHRLVHRVLRPASA
jgi:hypothetical protein